MKKMISGTGSGVRTHDLLIKSQLLYQLSYTCIGAVLRDNRKLLRELLRFVRSLVTEVGATLFAVLLNRIVLHQLAHKSRHVLI